MDDTVIYPVRLVYFAGSLYFLSVGQVPLRNLLRRYPKDNRRCLSEDRVIRWCVHSHPFPLRLSSTGLPHSNQNMAAA